MKSVGDLLTWGATQLSQIPDARFEAALLLGHVLHCDRAQLMTWPEKIATALEQSTFESYIARRQKGEPIAYIVGHKAFWLWDFIVTSDTLIPRAETETLIEQVLAHLPATPLKVLDVGTGTGIIACTLAKERPAWQVVATDISEKALAVAEMNKAQLLITNLEFHQTNWCEGFKAHSFDAMVSNPPYIRENDPHLVEGDCRFEPMTALVSGPTGLEAFEQLIPMAKTLLKPGGLLAFEHGFDQADDLQTLFQANGFSSIETAYDLAGKPRVILGLKR